VTPAKAVAFGAVGLVVGVPAVLACIVGVLILGGVTHVERASGERVFSVRYLFSHPGRSDIVAFHAPARAAALCGRGGVYVQRIVGLPGETWQEQKGRVYIDKQLLVEAYVGRGERDRLTHGPVKIPAGSYFVMGDDRVASCDSRRWGVLPRSAIIGRVIATWWPPSRIGLH
jgi:signal peptidase I